MSKRWVFLGILVLFWGGVPFPRPVQAQQVCRITALGAMVLPTRFNGRCWDIGCFGGKKKKLHKISQFLEQVKDILNWKMVLARKAFKFASTGTYLPDTFAIVKINGMEVLRTERSPNTLLPMWGQSAQLPISSSDTLEIYVYDWDRITSHDPMGFYASVGIPRKYITHGGIMKLRFGRVQEFHLMFKPLHRDMEKHLQVRRRTPPKAQPHPRPRGRRVALRPERQVPPPRSTQPPVRRRPLPRLFLPDPRLTPPKRLTRTNPPQIRPPQRRLVMHPHPRPRSRPSPLVLATKQAMGEYNLDKSKMLKMAKFLQDNLHKLPEKRQASARQTIQMIRGMKMSLQLTNHQQAMFTSVHRFAQGLVTREFRGTWSWHVPGKLLSLHLAEQGSSGKSNSQEMTVSCRYEQAILVCSNIHGRNHKYRFHKVQSQGR